MSPLPSHHVPPPFLSPSWARKRASVTAVWSALVSGQLVSCNTSCGLQQDCVWTPIWYFLYLLLSSYILLGAYSKGGEEGRVIRFRAKMIMITRTDAECNSHFSLLCYCSYGLALLLALANMIHFISRFSCWLGSHPPLGSRHQTPGWLQ